MFGQIDHTAEIATCAYFFGFQRTDKINGNYFSSVEKRRAFFPQEVSRTSQTYRRQNHSACPACCAFLSRRARLPWHAQKMCAVTIVGTVLKKILYQPGKSALGTRLAHIYKNRKEKQFKFSLVILCFTMISQ